MVPAGGIQYQERLRSIKKANSNGIVASKWRKGSVLEALKDENVRKL